MTEPVPDTLDDYLTADDLASLPYVSGTHLGFGVWPWTLDAVQAFATLKPAEQRALVLAAAQLVVISGYGPGSLPPTLFDLFALEMSCPR